MKRTSLFFALVALVISPFAVAQSGPAASTSKQQKVVKVATITGADAVHEFQHNVSVLQNELQAAKDLQAQVDKATDKKKKKDLQAELDAAMKKLDADNAVMAKHYGFSLTRNYVIDPEVINIYTVVSDEEAAKVEAAAKDQGKAKK
jgi:basic membrane lipoprotein Med (substrate-binding protein (PBP1-ABC) superfamily)